MSSTLRLFSFTSVLSAKLLAFVLAFLLLATPIAPVLAQETENTQPPETSQEENTSQESEPEESSESQEKESEPEEQKEKEEIEEPEAMSMFASTNPLIPTQAAEGTSLNSILPTTDLSTGALTYEYPISVPPGRNGFQPDLKLQYSSQKTDNDSPFGYGWSINIPYIERVNKTGSENLYTDDYFRSSVDDDLVLVSGSVYAPEVENGTFLKYVYSSNTWTVTDKKGVVYTFGSQASTRQDNPSDSTKIFKWMLEKVEDRNGNYITFTYYKNTGQIYPDTITYTHNGGANGIFEIKFLRESRTDTYLSYATAFAVTTSYRIDEIEIRISNTLVREYALSYTTGDNGYRSMLQSVVESGVDESSTTVTLPATEFTYSKNTSAISWSTDTSTWSAPYPFHDEMIVYVSDLNGDSYPDLTRSATSLNVNPGTGTNCPSYPFTVTNQDYYENDTEGGWSSSSDYAPPFYYDQCELRSGSFWGIWNQGMRLFEATGDFLPDLLQSLQISGSHLREIYENTGGWTSRTSSWGLPTLDFEKRVYSNYGFGTIIADLNGDGLRDILRKDSGEIYNYPYGSYPGTYWGEQLNTGTGYASATTDWEPPGVGFQHESQLADVNGDGLADFMQAGYAPAATGSWVYETYMNKGTGDWALNAPWATPMYFSHNGTDMGVRFVDINGDNLVDAITRKDSYGLTGFGTYLNTGNGWVYKSAIDTPDINYAGPTSTLTDLDADGLVDFFRVVAGSPNVTYAYINQGVIPDLLTGIETPSGATTAITYKPSSHYRDGSNNILNPNLPFIIQTVDSITVTDPVLGTAQNETFVYEGGEYNFVSVLDRKFARFAKVTKTDALGKTITYYHQGNSSNTSQGEYDDHSSKIGKIYRTERLDGSANVYQVTVNKWDKYNQGTGRDFVKLVRSTVLTYDGDMDHADTSTEYAYDNTYGNITTKTLWGKVTGSDDGSFTDTGTDKSVETTSYTANTTDYIVGLPYQETVVDQSASKVRETKTYYDTLSLGSVSKGNPTKVERWKNSTNYVNTQKTYNATYGTVTSDIDERGKTTSYTYDAYNLYPATVTNPLTQDTDYLYDYSLGKPKQVTDDDGFVYQTVYDGLDRVLSEKIPGDTTPFTPVVKNSYVYTDTQGAMAILETKYLDASNTASTYYYMDGLYRLIQKRAEAEANYNTQDYAYNTSGLLQKESLPYSSSGTSRTSATGTTALYITYVYDTMLRPSSITNAIGTTSYAYDDWKTTVTDPRSKVKHYYKDAYEYLVQVDEVNGGSTYNTYYEWNLNKNLTKITDALSNVRNFTYDGLGRRTSAEDLHAPADGTYGSWTYTYDDAGNMTQSVSPRSNTINYTYDDVNRVLTENYTGQGGTEITYTYDSCMVGKLCTVTMLDGADTAYDYDSNGRLIYEDRDIDTGTYVTEYTYDRQGNKTLVIYPDDAEVKYIYNTAGELEKIEYKESGGSFADVVSDFDYGPHGKVTYQDNQNGTSTTNTYDATKMYRLTNRTTIDTTPDDLQNLTYAYDNNSNITQIVDASDTDSSKTVDYVYDDLNRLTSATATNVAGGQSTYTHTFAYDALGNITSGSVGTYLYQGTGYANPHAATSINGTTVVYDEDGNVTDDGTLENTWNYKGQLENTTDGVFSIDYLYDQEGNRVFSSDGVTDTHYANKLYSTDGTTDTKSIYAGDVLVATVETVSATPSLYYVHTDHLGGTNVVTDDTGAQVELLDYFPYGSQRIASGAHDSQKQYTGHYYDADTALTYMGARYYNGGNGRFVSQDPAFLNIGRVDFEEKYNRTLTEHLQNPQALNSYSYALNNPIQYVDSNGEIIPLIGPAAVAIITSAFNATVTALTAIKVGEVSILAYYDLRYGTNNSRDIRNGLIELGLGPTAKGVGAIAGTTKELTQINTLITALEATEILGATPDAVKQLGSNIKNFIGGTTTIEKENSHMKTSDNKSQERNSTEKSTFSNEEED